MRGFPGSYFRLTTPEAANDTWHFPPSETIALGTSRVWCHQSREGVTVIILALYQYSGGLERSTRALRKMLTASAFRGMLEIAGSVQPGPRTTASEPVKAFNQVGTSRKLLLNTDRGSVQTMLQHRRWKGGRTRTSKIWMRPGPSSDCSTSSFTRGITRRSTSRISESQFAFANLDLAKHRRVSTNQYKQA